MVGAFVVCVLAMGLLEQQFFPSSDRPEVLVEISLPQGTAIAVTERTARKVEAALRREPEAHHVSTYVGAGAPRFFISMNPERSEEHTSELQSLMRISYAVFCLKKKNNIKHPHFTIINTIIQ